MLQKMPKLSELGFLTVLLNLLIGINGQDNYFGGAYSRLNPIAYYGFTQPYLSGFYGGIGGMPYMSSWQASMFQGNNAQTPLGLLGLSGLGGLGPGAGFGGLGYGGGFGSFNTASGSYPTFCVFILPFGIYLYNYLRTTVL